MEKTFAIVRQYEYSGDPQMLSLLAEIYSTGYGEFDSDEARDQKVVEYLKKAALCGHRRALYLLAGSYDEGKHGLAPSPQMARCLRGMLETDQNAVRCGVTLEKDRRPEPSAMRYPMGWPIPGI